MPPGSTTSSTPFWSRARVALAGLAFALPGALLAVLSSCSASDAGDGSADGTSGAGGGGSTVAVGTGGDADATVPDAQPDVTPPTYEDLCGDGPCLPGPDDGCSPSIDGSEAGRASGPGELAHQGTRRDLEVLGCQVIVDDEGEPATACLPTGAGAIDAPCQRSVDCQRGSACVPTEGSSNPTAAGICRPYCCGELEECGQGSFCAPRSLVEEPDLDVPVCVAVTPCELLEDGSCPVGTTCSVVRADGTTSCAPPGNGERCEPCPCAAGYVCAVHTGLCQKLCRTDGAEDDCGGGLCQGGSSSYPVGIGVCVGGAEEDCSDR